MVGLQAAVLLLVAGAAAGPSESAPVAPGPSAAADSARARLARATGTAPPDTTTPRSSVVPLPAVFYSQETGLGGGGLVLWTFRLGDSEASRRRPSTVSPLFLITERKQLLARIAADIYSPGGAWRFTGRVGYLRFPDLFWGVGNDTPDDAEEEYTPWTLDCGLGLQRLLPRDWFVGVDVNWARRTLQDLEEGGLIDMGQVVGTEDGRIVGAGVKLRRDTRNWSISPSRGGTFEIAGRTHREALGSDFEFDEWSVDLRRYRPIGRAVLAGRAFGVFTSSGDPPFDRLPGLGGDSLLRGTYAGRYRDRHLAALQLEARIPIWWRLGAVAFGAAAQVAAEPDRFTGDGFHPALGFGLRFRPREEDRTNLRFDWGIGDTGSAFYFALGEAF